MENRLIEASRNGNIGLVKTLINSGVDVHAENNSALRWAAKNDHLEIVRLLLDHGANVHALDDYSLRWATNNSEVVRLLLDHGANIHARDDQTLRSAAENDHLEVVRLLLDHKANIFSLSSDSQLKYSHLLPKLSPEFENMVVREDNGIITLSNGRYYLH